MATKDDSRRFEETETRPDEMRRAITDWLGDLSEMVDEAKASAQFTEWLDVQSRFHEYSYKNILLIRTQYPDATRVAGYRTWQEDFERQVKTGESAIWIWAPIIARQCPACGHSPTYHERTECSYAERPPEEWSKGVVSFRPVPVFDVSQTEGEPLPELETAATGSATDLFVQLRAASDSLDVSVTVTDEQAWTHGNATGVCSHSNSGEAPVVEIKRTPNTADMAVTLVHEYAHALCHGNSLAATADEERESERATREVEAEAVAYIVGRHFGLDTSGSAFYLAAWKRDGPAELSDRLERISRTARTIIEAVESDW